MKLRAKTSTFCKLIHPKYRNSSVGPKNKKNRSIEIYFSIDLDRNSGRSLSVQINRKIDLNKGEIYFSYFLDRQTNFNTYQFAKSCGFSPYFHILLL